MSHNRNLARLISHIARHTHHLADIQATLQTLQEYPDWAEAIEKESRRIRSREQKRVQNANKRAMQKGLPDTLTVPEWFETLYHFNWRCAYCQLPFSYEELEHFHPLADEINRLGTVSFNCVPSCRACNARKGSKPYQHWVRRANQLQLPLTGVPEDDFAENIKRVAQVLDERYRETTFQTEIGLDS